MKTSMMPDHFIELKHTEEDGSSMVHTVRITGDTDSMIQAYLNFLRGIGCKINDNEDRV